MLPTLAGVAVLVFVLMRVLPGDIVELRFAGESSFASKAALDLERRRLGLDAPRECTPVYVSAWRHLAQLVSPALAVGYRYSAVATRMMRSAMLEVLREDYVRTARAKGLWPRLVLWRHAVRNAMLPVFTVIVLEFAFLIGGLVVTEQVFNLNGLGLLFVESIAHRDYTLTQALVLLVAVITVLANFVAVLVYVWLDPRIRYA